MKISNRLKLLLSSSAMTYTLIKGVISVYRGYHNLDLSFNFLNLGYTQDITLKGYMISLQDAYINGLNQMLGGVGWLCLSILFALVLGYFIGRVKE